MYDVGSRHNSDRDEDIGPIPGPETKRQEGNHDPSDPLVEVCLPLPPKYLHPMSLIIPLFGRLSESPSEALNCEVSNGPDSAPEDMSGIEHDGPQPQTPAVDSSSKGNALLNSTSLGLLQKADRPISRRERKRLRQEVDRTLKQERLGKDLIQRFDTAEAKTGRLLDCVQSMSESLMENRLIRRREHETQQLMTLMRMYELMGDTDEVRKVREKIIAKGTAPLDPVPSRPTPPLDAGGGNAKDSEDEEHPSTRSHIVQFVHPPTTAPSASPRTAVANSEQGSNHSGVATPQSAHPDMRSSSSAEEERNCNTPGLLQSTLSPSNLTAPSTMPVTESWEFNGDEQWEMDGDASEGPGVDILGGGADLHLPVAHGLGTEDRGTEDEPLIVD